MYIAFNYKLNPIMITVSKYNVQVIIELFHNTQK